MSIKKFLDIIKQIQEERKKIIENRKTTTLEIAFNKFTNNIIELFSLVTDIFIIIAKIMCIAITINGVISVYIAYFSDVLNSNELIEFSKYPIVLIVTGGIIITFKIRKVKINGANI